MSVCRTTRESPVMSTSDDRTPRETPPAGRPIAAGKTVKISAHLFALAESEANLEQRSTQKQVEYWSLLGRVVERSLRKEERQALLSEQKVIANLELADVFPAGDSIMAELEHDRASGKLRSQLSSAPYLYETVEGKTDLFRRLAADGSETLGTFVEGEFVEAS